ncbi:MAG: hypothetical protein IJ352_01140 [Muribaculaceae bacterium]|nr:hypothetical protein [Muribaculaceae bacterium]
MDELNEYLECTCGRCDDGICCCSDFDSEPPQYTTDDLDYDYNEDDEDEEIENW